MGDHSEVVYKCGCTGLVEVHIWEDDYRITGLEIKHHCKDADERARIQELEEELALRKRAVQVMFDEYHEASCVLQGRDAWDVATAAYGEVMGRGDEK